MMALEIERKFLAVGDEWCCLGEGSRICQGYLVRKKERTVRVRVYGDAAYLTIKGEAVDGVTSEYEYEIPLDDARELLENLCLKPLIEKIRYRLEYEGLCWEVDEFSGENSGLVLAEVELEKRDQAVLLPPWIGEEVTGDSRYFNANLVENPYSTW